MSDALALPFSVYGVNTGSYTISHAFSIRQNNSYSITPDKYDLGAIIAAACSGMVMANTPYYFLPASNGTVFVPAFVYGGNVSLFGVIYFSSSAIIASNENALTASILLFKAT